MALKPIYALVWQGGWKKYANKKDAQARIREWAKEREAEGLEARVLSNTTGPHAALARPGGDLLWRNAISLHEYDRETHERIDMRKILELPLAKITFEDLIGKDDTETVKRPRRGRPPIAA